MSAPRQIWVAPWMFETRHQNPVRRKNHESDGDYRYHHDDVVRELVESLDDMADLFSADNALKRGTHLNATLCRARRALAKIAQEG